MRDSLSNMEVNILSRLAMLKMANNVNKRFEDAINKLGREEVRKIGEAIRNNDENNPISKSLLRWAANELSIITEQN